MTTLAVSAAQQSHWLAVDVWESQQTMFIPTFVVVRRVQAGIRAALAKNGCQRPVDVALVIGADLRDAMRAGETRGWPRRNVHRVLTSVWAIVWASRAGSSDACAEHTDTDDRTKWESCPGVHVLEIQTQSSVSYTHLTLPTTSRV